MVGRLLARARRPAVGDAALAAGLLAVVVLLGPPYPPAPRLWWVATAAALTALGLRNRWPVAALVAGAAATAVHVGQGALISTADGAVLILVYTVAARHRRAASLTALSCVLLAVLGWSGWFTVQGRLVPGMPVLTHQVRHAGSGHAPTTQRLVLIAGQHASGAARWSGPAVLCAALVAAWAIGHGSRIRRAYLDQLTARARDLEREQKQLAALAVAAERGRINRELHDVVAHGLSLIVIQAQGGAAALDSEPAETRTALEAIVRTGRESLTDMRRVLDAMGEVDDAWHPQPGLAQLPALVDQVRRAGTPVRLRVDGTAVPLPAPVDLSAFRIAQEAMTNVMKHAGAASRAEVTVAYRETALELTISDDGGGAGRSAVTGNRRGTGGTAGTGNGRGSGGTAGTGDGTGTGGSALPGNGISGMRERVRLLGGHLSAGPRPGRGFEVRVTLPIQEPPA